MLEQIVQFTIGGVVIGCVYAIAASGLVLTYTTTGVFNFAHGAVGGLSAFVYWWITIHVGVPPIVGVPLVVLVFATGMGAVLERVVFRNFRRSSVETTLVVTIALTLFVLGLSQQLFDPQTARALPPLLGDGSIELAGVLISYDDLLALVLAGAVAVSLRVLLFGTTLGTNMRAVVDDPQLAQLSGARPTRIASASWMLGSALAALSGILFASGQQLNAIILTFLVLSAYAAAMVGRLKSLPATFAGAIALGVVQELTNIDLYGDLIDVIPGVQQEFGNRLRLAIPALFLFGAMLIFRQERLGAHEEPNRSRVDLPTLPATLRWGTIFIAVAFVAQFVIPDTRLLDVNRGLVFSIVMLSLVLATGFAGQINLAVYVFMALGATTMGSLFSGTSPLGLLLALLVPVPIAVLVALPTLRLHGLYLALATFAFALAARELLLGDRRILGTSPQPVGRPRLGPLDSASDGAFMVLLAAIFVALSVGLLAVRRSSFGRRITAIRDSEPACATLGLDVRGVKLAVFAGSASIAGLGGALLGGLNTVVTDVNFEPIFNLQVFLFAVVGGVTSITGALIGGMLFAALAALQTEQPALGGLVFACIGGAAIALGKQPNGLAGMLFERLGSARRAVDAAFSTERPASAPAETSVVTRVLAEGERV